MRPVAEKQTHFTTLAFWGGQGLRRRTAAILLPASPLQGLAGLLFCPLSAAASYARDWLWGNIFSCKINM
jgi:hypothetical protein